jgi:hypothetical protein
LAAPSGAPFELVSWGSGPLTNGVYDHWIGFGFNAQVFIDPARGRAGEPAWFMGFEDAWSGPGSDRLGAEWYVAYFSPDHTSVSLFRPFYTRVQRNDDSDHSALTLLDIGTDGKGLFGVTTGSFNEIFAVTPSQVVFKPTSGNSFLVLDAASGSSPYLQFRIDSQNGFYFKGSNIGLLRLKDRNSRLHMQFVEGRNEIDAMTEVFSSLSFHGSLVSAGGPLEQSASDGFVYLPTIAGPPSGTPTAVAGAVPVAFDSDDGLFRYYASDAWESLAPARSPAFAGGVTVSGDLTMRDPGAALRGAGASGPLVSFDANNLGFFGAKPTGQPTVSGATHGDDALVSLISALAGLGLIVDDTTS